MLFTDLGRSVLGETVPSVWVPPSAYGLGRYSRPRAQFLPIRTSQPVNNIYIFKEQEEEKQRKYQQKVLDVEMGSFTPLVF